MGTHKISITPNESMWMAGYAARNKPSEGKIHDLYTRAVALRDTNGNQLVIISAEVIGIRRDDRAWLERELQSRWGIKPDEFLINVTHTHSGPEFRLHDSGLHVIPEDQVEKSRRYRQFLRESISRAVGAALDDMTPASLEYSMAQAGFAMNRRLKTEKGYVIAPNRFGPVDHEVPVLKISAPDDQIKALIFGYACHATVLDLYDFCGDWPGFAQQVLEKRFPGATALFINGCSGDQNPVPRRRLELARQYGECIANAVEGSLEAQTEPVKGPLRSRLEEVRIYFDNIPNLAELKKMEQSGNKYDERRAGVLKKDLEKHGEIQESYPYLVQVVKFGDSLLLAALSGEVVVDYSLRLKKEIKDRNVWVAGYSNDVMGYLPSRRVREEGGYEGTEAVHYSTLPGTWRLDTEELVIGKVKELVSRP